MTPEERRRLILLQREYSWRIWPHDEKTFLREACKIRHPERGLIPFELRDAQEEGLRAWATNRYSLTLKARQIGWSTLVAGHVLWIAFFQKDREIILISRTEREAVDLLRKVRVMYDNLPAWLRERGPELTTNHQQKMPFDNGSIRPGRRRRLPGSLRPRLPLGRRQRRGPQVQGGHQPERRPPAVAVRRAVRARER
jgi:hypothetical protein